MESVKEQPLTATSPHLVEWPGVPQLSIQNKATPEIIPFRDEQVPSISITNAEGREIGNGNSTLARNEEKLDLGSLKQKPVALQNFTEAWKPQKLKERVLKPLRKVAPIKQSWPEPHLSLGIECNSLDGNECWKACGPAQGLFAQISESIRNLLDIRVGELEEGEPKVGDILAFDMYMVGKRVTMEVNYSENNASEQINQEFLTRHLNCRFTSIQ